MAIRRLESGRWEASYRDPRGRERTKTFATKRDAERWRAANVSDVARGAWLDPRLGTVRVADWIDRWWPTTVNLRPSTRVRDQGYLERYVLPDFGDDQLGRLTQPDVQAWVAALSARGLAPATVTKAYQLLGKVLGAAVDAGLIPSSPCQRVSLPAKSNEEMRFLTPAQVGELAEVIHPRFRALVLLAAYGGLRVGELAGLRRPKLDTLHARVEVAEIAVEVRGVLTYGPPKTKAGQRSIALPRPVATELAAHVERWSSTEWVFTAPDGGPLRVPGWRQRFWKPAVEQAGLVPLRPHDLRHTAVALWIAAGANVLEVARRAGHSSTSFTLDRYGHLFPEADLGLAERLELLYQPPSNAPVAALRPISATSD